MGHIWDSIAQTQEPDCEGVNISIAIPYISDFEQGPGPLCASAFFFFFFFHFCNRNQQCNNHGDY